GPGRQNEGACFRYARHGVADTREIVRLREAEGKLQRRFILPWHRGEPRIGPHANPRRQVPVAQIGGDGLWDVSGPVYMLHTRRKIDCHRREEVDAFFLAQLASCRDNTAWR